MTTLPSLCRPIARIQEVVAEAYHTSPSYMTRPCRERSIAWPRQVAMYLARKETGHSFPHIAKCFGGYDHTTVIYAVRTVEKRMAASPVYAQDIEVIRGRLAKQNMEAHKRAGRGMWLASSTGPDT